MLNINILNGALWRIQHAKSEQQSHNRQNNLEGSWVATQKMAELLKHESQIVNMIAQHDDGSEYDNVLLENFVKEIYKTLPEVR